MSRHQPLASQQLQALARQCYHHHQHQQSIIVLAIAAACRLLAAAAAAVELRLAGVAT
jgi:hypothetical protein